LSSHPAALAQCKAYLEQWPWDRLEAASTAQAASEVAAAADPTWAAIGSAAAAQIHGLTVLAHDLQGNARNETRFVIVERRDQFA
jgi:prephenate dehydratase